VQVSVDLADAARGTREELSFEAVDVCEHCHGNGAEPGTPIETCERCGGAGRLQAVSRTPFGQVVRTVDCDVCHGDGRVPQTPCARCDGRGREVRVRTLEVDVPAGIADGQRVRLSGRGHAGEAGGPAGDLYVVVQVRPDPRFIRDGDDLVTVLDVPAPQAALGGTLRAPSLLDGDVEVELPAGTQPGATITLRGRGMPVLRRPGRHGDLRVVANVVIPRRLTREQRALLEQLATSITPENLTGDEGMVSKLKRLFHA
jgi:molecular chaperone DnaJ